MRYPASEKLEIIRLVEQSHLPVKRTLKKFGIPRATGIVGSFVLRPVSSLSAEPIAEDDGELGPGLEPLARRPFPFVGLAIKDQI